MAALSSSDAIKKTGTDTWEEAWDSLRQEDKDAFSLAFKGKKNLKEIFRDVLEATDLKKRVFLEKRTKISFGGKEVVLRDVLSKLAIWANQFVAIGDAISQYDPGHVALPWAAIRFLLLVTAKEENMYGSILAGVERIANIAARCAVFEHLYLPKKSDITERLLRSLVELYTEMLSFLSKCVRYFESSTAKKIVKSVFTTKDVETSFSSVTAKQQAVEKNHELAEVELTVTTLGEVYVVHEQQHQYAAESRQRDEQLRNILLELTLPMSKVDIQLADLRNRVQTQDQRRILESISTIPYNSHHASMSKDRLAGSGQWLLEKPAFQSWRNDDSSSVLWLHGIPGSGKTKLTSLVIDEVGDGNTAFFYCAKNTAEPGRAEAESILSCLVKQLACAPTSGVIFDTVRLRYSAALKGTELFQDVAWTTRGSIDALIDLTSLHATTILVLDALDEVNELEITDLLEALTMVMQESENVVKIFLSSRDRVDINLRLRNHPNLYINVNDNSGDIEAFVHNKLGTVNLLQGPTSSALRRQTATALIEGAQGMFRWADLQIQMLRKLKVRADIKARLGRLPKSLESLYWEIFDQIEELGEHAEQLARLTFQWLLFAQEQLELETFAAFASEELRDADDSYTEDDVLEVCLNLVTKDSDGTFRFAHLSVREFLETSVLARGIQDFLPSQANARIGSICLTHLSNILQEALDRSGDQMTAAFKLRDSHKGSIVLDGSDSTNGQSGVTIVLQNYDQMEFTLTGYAALNWVYHVYSTGDAEVPEPLKTQVLDFLLEKEEVSPQFQLWCTKVRCNTDNMRGVGNFGDIIYAAGATGHPIWFLGHSILAKSGKIFIPNIDHGKRRQILETAAQVGNLSIMEQILELGVSQEDMTQVLSIVIPDRKYSAVSLLVSRGAYADEKTWRKTIYHLEDPQILTTLLEKQDARSLAGLIQAWSTSLGNRDAIIAIIAKSLESALLNPAIDIEEIEEELCRLGMPKHGSCLVVQCIEIDCMSLARKLIDHGFDIHGQHLESQRTALHSCSEKGDTGMVEMLLSKGVDVNISDRDCKTPLHLAVERGHFPVVETLLRHGTQLERRDRFSNWPLYLAVERGHYAMVEALLRRGSRLDGCNIYLNRPLHRAVHECFPSIVQLLLEKGACANVFNSDMEAPLHLAVKKRRPDIVEMLLANGAIVNNCDEDSDMPIHLALRMPFHQMTVIKALLERGAQVNVGDKHANTPLHLAIKSQFRRSPTVVKPDIVHLLLEHGAQVNVFNKVNDTPLHFAALFGNLAIVRALLEKGARASARNNSHTTPAQLAATYGHAKVLGLLLAYGADHDAKDTATFESMKLRRMNASETVLHHQEGAELSPSEEDSDHANDQDIEDGGMEFESARDIDHEVTTLSTFPHPTLITRTMEHLEDAEDTPSEQDFDPASNQETREGVVEFASADYIHDEISTPSKSRLSAIPAIVLTSSPP